MTPPEEIIYIYIYIDVWKPIEASGVIWKHLEPSGGTRVRPRTHQEAAKRHPGSTQEATRKHPGSTQEAPGGTKGTREVF